MAFDRNLAIGIPGLRQIQDRSNLNHLSGAQERWVGLPAFRGLRCHSFL